MKKIKVYEYNHKGEYIMTYDNVNEFRKSKYPNDIGKRPIFVNKVNNIEYHILENTIALLERPGRETIKFIIAVHNSKFCKKSDKEEPIEVYNLLGEKIAEFKNERLMCKLLPHIPQNMINRQLNSKKRSTLNSTGLYFKRKLNE